MRRRVVVLVVLVVLVLVLVQDRCGNSEFV
jgi:hypothetical protein